MKAIILMCCLWAVPVNAQQIYQTIPDTMFRVSMVSAVAAHGADLGSTMYGLGTGRVHETNPFLLRFSNQPAVFGATKMGIAAASLWMTAFLHAKHPRLATWVNFGVTAAMTSIAIHNTRVERSTQK